jgi:ribosome modulation factor
MCETRPPYNRTIGECMDVSTQRGKDDWLSGASSDENPYDEEDYISYAFWLIGWYMADGESK